MRTAQLTGWTIAASLVILLSRTLAYAVSPSPAAELLQHRAGGPALPMLALAALGAGAAVAIAVTYLAWLGVRERALLEHRAAPELRLGRAGASAFALFTVTAPLGGLLEAYIHWRHGLGWHGFHCVFGPVHRNLLPIDGALSLIATAISVATRHVLTWMRRTLGRLAAAATPLLHVLCAERPACVRARPCAPRLDAASARAPPALS
jgi:hypothetical protein